MQYSRLVTLSQSFHTDSSASGYARRLSWDLASDTYPSGFRCNVCGRENHGDPTLFTRETGACSQCKATVRMRAAVCALSLGLFGKPLAIPDFPKSPPFTGLGLSDWEGYANRLKKRLAYRNTFLHQSPFLDITNPPEELAGKHDFLISIDVFEHIPPPVDRAFLGAASLLKRGACLVLSVPYSLHKSTVEHFPDLHQFEVVHAVGGFCLVNRRSDGTLEVFDRLNFHGGPGHTLEMRLFSKADLLSHLTAAGFGEVQVISEDLAWGIHYDNDCSHTILASKT
ncbi:MAG: class I SAM-dependent methyltransferase, partial [Bryobacteraceae bacterium]